MQPLSLPLLALTLSLLTAATSAQSSITDIPSCARSAALNGITQTGCKLTDPKCLCKDQDWLTNLLPVVEKACNDADLQKTTTFAQKFCSNVGVTLSISSVSPASSNASPPSSTPASGPAPSATTSLATGASSRHSSSAAATGARLSSSVSSPASSANSTVLPANGGAVRVAGVGGVVAVGLGAVGAVVALL